jgi:hypothetical protein
MENTPNDKKLKNMILNHISRYDLRGKKPSYATFPLGKMTLIAFVGKFSQAQWFFDSILSFVLYYGFSFLRMFDVLSILMIILPIKKLCKFTDFRNDKF